MLKAIAWAGWLVISRKERALRVRTGQTSETDLRWGESCWQRQDVETGLLGVRLFLLVTFSWDKNQDASFLFSGVCLNKAFSNFFLWWESWETFPPISCPLSTWFCLGGHRKQAGESLQAGWPDGCERGFVHSPRAGRTGADCKVSFKCQLRSHTPWLHIAKKWCYFEGRKTHFLQIKMNTETKHHVVS